MINYNNEFLYQFIKTYKVIDKDVCKSCIKNINKSEGWNQHTFYNEGLKKSHTRSGSKELSVLYYHQALGEQKKIIMDSIWHALNKYFKDLDTPWFTEWHGYTAIRFNRYKKNKKMALHCDHIHSMFDGKRKGIPFLSILGSLNDDYEGGEFIMFDKKEYKIKAGQVLIFPSSFMFPHKVEHVTKRTRYTYISWVF